MTFIKAEHVYCYDYVPDGERLYRTPIGMVAGVTTVLSGTKPESEAKKLDSWKQWVGEEEAERVRKEASLRGTWVHNRIEELLLWKPVQDKADGWEVALPYWQAIEPFVANVQSLWTEATVYYLHAGEYGYAGSFDCLGVIDDKVTLFDWKTASKPCSKSKLADYRLQIGAYAQGIEFLSDYEIEQAIIAVATPNKLQLVPLSRQEVDESIAGFNERLISYYETRF